MSFPYHTPPERKAPTGTIFLLVVLIAAVVLGGLLLFDLLSFVFNLYP